MFKITKSGGGDELYRINTRTGQVWLHTERVLISTESISGSAAQKAGLEKLIEGAGKQGKNVYTLPYWAPTNETAPETYTVH